MVVPFIGVMSNRSSLDITRAHDLPMFADFNEPAGNFGSQLTGKVCRIVFDDYVIVDGYAMAQKIANRTTNDKDALCMGQKGCIERKAHQPNLVTGYSRPSINSELPMYRKSCATQISVVAPRMLDFLRIVLNLYSNDIKYFQEFLPDEVRSPEIREFIKIERDSDQQISGLILVWAISQKLGPNENDRPSAVMSSYFN